MRISTNMLYSSLLTGIGKQQSIQDSDNAKISSGTRFQTPAQSGLDYKVSLDIRHSQIDVQSSIDASKTIETRLEASQTMLNDMSNILKRASVLAVQQASGQSGNAEHQAALQEVNHLSNQLLDDANNQWQGQALFAGTAVDKQAFAADGTYTGSSQDRIVSVSSNQQVVSNIRGDNVAFTHTFTAIQAFKTALGNNDQAAIQTALGQLNQAADDMVNLTSDVGSRLHATQISRTSFEDMKINLDKQLNMHEGVDIPAIVAEMQQSSIALKAAYNQITQLKSLSLTNFLR